MLSAFTSLSETASASVSLVSLVSCSILGNSTCGTSVTSLEVSGITLSARVWSVNMASVEGSADFSFLYLVSTATVRNGSRGNR